MNKSEKSYGKYIRGVPFSMTPSKWIDLAIITFVQYAAYCMPWAIPLSISHKTLWAIFIPGAALLYTWCIVNPRICKNRDLWVYCPRTNFLDHFLSEFSSEPKPLFWSSHRNGRGSVYPTAAHQRLYPTVILYIFNVILQCSDCRVFCSHLYPLIALLSG